MITKVFPAKTSTLYSYYPSGNMGKDAIMELSFGGNNGNQPSRMLAYFTLNSIYEKTASLNSSGSLKYQLKFYNAYSQQVEDNIVVKCYSVSGSWDEGYGELNFLPQLTSSVSWVNKQSLIPWVVSGGDYYNSPTSSYTVNTDTQTVDHLLFDVSQIVNSWTGGIDNHGFLIKFETESSPNNPNSLKYFSRHTTTIYKPELLISWDDSTYNTGSYTSLNVEVTQSQIEFINLKQIYKNYEVSRIYFKPKPLLVSQQYFTTSQAVINYYLNSSSFYAVKDIRTGEIFGYDETYSKISCNSGSHYFDFDFSILSPNRYYSFLIKTKIGFRVVEFDNLSIFKIVDNYGF